MTANANKLLYQTIAADLATGINSDRYTEGSLLPSERELAITFAVSRATMREALLTLQASGLIILRHKARARVTRLSSHRFMDQLSGAARTLLSNPNGVADFHEARMLFESGLARYAARHASPKEIAKLAMALEENRRALKAPAEFARTDLAFHTVLAEIPRNPIFTALNSALSGWLLEQRELSMRVPVPGAMRRAHAGHAAIFAAIAAHDAEAADSAVMEHLKFVSQLQNKTARQMKRKNATTS